ncbi:hypothetical protein FQN54_006926 [Arachnomyces sp. PD_36]|nr:hypothetical protein FQN54_006926 [Arachnomyces sp. PD_36]
MTGVWMGVVLRVVNASDFDKDSLETYFSTEEDELDSDPSQMLFGNEAGRDHVKELRELKSEKSEMEAFKKHVEKELKALREVEKEVKALRENEESRRERDEIYEQEGKDIRERLGLSGPEHSLILDLRRSVLDGRPPGRDAAHAIYRNRLAHGGHVMADLVVLRKSEEAGEALFDRFKANFQNFYEIDYDEMKDEIGKAPEEVIRTFDMQMDVKTLDIWKTGDARKAATSITPKCDRIVAEWIRWVRAGKENKCPDNRKEFEEMKEAYMSQISKAAEAAEAADNND